MKKTCAFCGRRTNYFDWRLGVYICVQCKAIYDSIVYPQPLWPKFPLECPIYDSSTVYPKWYFRETFDTPEQMNFMVQKEE